MDIYETLKNDHEEVKDLLTELCSLRVNDDYRIVLVQEIKSHLIPHMRAEELVFYNALKAVNKDKNSTYHGFEEHKEAEALIKELEAMDKASSNWMGMAEKLKEAIFHHIEEEESNLFAEARSAFSQEEASSMGEAFESLKPKVKSDRLGSDEIESVISMMPSRLVDKMKRRGEVRPS